MELNKEEKVLTGKCLIQTPIWIISESSILPLSIADRISGWLKEFNLLPNNILDPLNILIKSSHNSWEYFDYTNKHYLNKKLLHASTEDSGISINLQEFFYFFSCCKRFLPKIQTDSDSDYPYLISAQLQLIGEFYNMSPDQILAIFAIIYDGKFSNDWESFSWKLFLERDYTSVSISKNKNIFNNNLNLRSN